MLAFYNGGEGAGASQKWRHLQFVEVPGGRAPVEEWIQGMQFDRLGAIYSIIFVYVCNTDCFVRRQTCNPAKHALPSHRPPLASVCANAGTSHFRIDRTTY